jgi:carbon storage regulator CsrA
MPVSTPAPLFTVLTHTEVNMLVLGRRVDQKIYIGTADNPRLIEIEVVRMSEEVVKLGLTAPDTFSIHREEVLNRIEAEGAAT